MSIVYVNGYNKDDIHICVKCYQTCKDHEMIPMRHEDDHPDETSMVCPACKKCSQFVRVPKGEDIAPYMDSVDGLKCVFGVKDF